MAANRGNIDAVLDSLVLKLHGIHTFASNVKK